VEGLKYSSKGVFIMSVEPIMEVKRIPYSGAQPGDTVKVSTRIIEGEKERTQLFQGVVIRLRKGAAVPVSR